MSFLIRFTPPRLAKRLQTLSVCLLMISGIRAPSVGGSCEVGEGCELTEYWAQLLKRSAKGTWNEDNYSMDLLIAMMLSRSGLRGR